MYINDAELAGTTRLLCYNEVYVISGLVISRDDLYKECFVMIGLLNFHSMKAHDAPSPRFSGVSWGL